MFTFSGSILHVSVEPRFCERIRHPDEETATFFRLVFSNRTFRVYKYISMVLKNEFPLSTQNNFKKLQNSTQIFEYTN
uniref:Uncharacterized protein n=1 Tax=Parascaris equorum TaxID=6256 RepID=A0A914RMG6_PAREQ